MRDLVTAVLLAAWPALAQAQAGPPDGVRPPAPPARVDASLPPPPLGRQIDVVQGAVDDADRSDRLRRADARRATREVGQIRDLTDRYAAGGLSASERREIETRADVMRSIVDAPARAGRR